MVQAVALSNVIIGGQWANVVSLRVVPKTSAPLAAVRLYRVVANPPGKAGYAAGTGGHFSYELATDVGGKPNLTFATASLVLSRPTQNQRGDFPLVCFPPMPLTVGTAFHIVVRNTDPAPKLNWSSLDFLTHPMLIDQTPDVSVLVTAEGVPWEPVDKGQVMGSPVGLVYADGTVQGYGYIAAGSQYGPSGLEGGEAYGFPASICQGAQVTS